MKEGFWRFVSDYGDFASILGFATSIIGFGLTLLSARGARRAAEQARKDVFHLRLQLLGDEIGSCLRSIRTLSEACHGEQTDWGPAVRNCEEALSRVPRLQASAYLDEGEKSNLGLLVDDLTLTYVMIVDIKNGRRKHLPKSVAGRFAVAIRLLSGIEGRLRSSEAKT